MTLAAGHRERLRSTLADFEGDQGVADLLAELAEQIDNIRRTFGRKPPSAAADVESGDVVFVDDLEHCLKCSWSKPEAAAGSQLTPDIVAQCSRLLEASLQILRQVQGRPRTGARRRGRFRDHQIADPVRVLRLLCRKGRASIENPGGCKVTYASNGGQISCGKP
jgi:hypothetical protein